MIRPIFQALDALVEVGERCVVLFIIQEALGPLIGEYKLATIPFNPGMNVIKCTG